MKWVFVRKHFLNQRCCVKSTLSNAYTRNAAQYTHSLNSLHSCAYLRVFPLILGFLFCFFFLVFLSMALALAPARLESSHSFSTQTQNISADARSQDLSGEPDARAVFHLCSKVTHSFVFPLNVAIFRGRSSSSVV